MADETEQAPSPEQEPPPRARNPMAFLIAVIALVAVGWYLVNWMSETTRLQDCVMSGRKNCAPLDPALGR